MCRQLNGRGRMLRSSISLTILLFTICVVTSLLTTLSNNSERAGKREINVPKTAIANKGQHLSEHPLWVKQSLTYVPVPVVSAWEERRYLVVIGIPSIDLDVRRRRRDLQRAACWTYAGVAVRANGFSGEMLPLYILARHPENGYTYTKALVEEATQWSDILTLPMNEGRPSGRKRVGQGGKWGIDAEIGMSRKTFLWFDMSVCLFPYAPYIAKADDDMFLRVPQYLADLRNLPRRGLYWGTIDVLSVQGFRFNYAYGACYTLGRDVAERFVSYKPLRTIIHVPYTAIRDEEFQSLCVMVEDAMVGITLRRAMYHTNITYVHEPKCSFHDVHAGTTLGAVTKSSIMVHHVNESDYNELRRRFNNEKNILHRSLTGSQGPLREMSCL
ncbi:UDP-Gal or UDP-GlcNAc-dependent glycosyltransferase [Trypanosoma brucei equiperdum]|uniref:Hexosyltransferase n=1 Tax=Trypanosoma brucei equiperdum TaxID=630700 RepID=A0A3L6LBS2_9TRYP|nr:UDP-Gal or UDP-GlcNAc-dependent glycosyltransferase [Trypanosoma brucei equiperdum]